MFTKRKIIQVLDRILNSQKNLVGRFVGERAD